VVKKRVDYESLVNWIREECIVSSPSLRERIIIEGHVSPNSVIENLRKKHKVISIRMFKDEERRYGTYFMQDDEWSKESSTWMEYSYGPLEDVSFMLGILKRHGYSNEKEDYKGLPRTYRVSAAGVLGWEINWCEPTWRDDQDHVSKGGPEEELKGCQDSIQQETKEKRGGAMPIQKLYACTEAQYARDIRTMGIERANWWQA
jgi:hypothetical protein